MFGILVLLNVDNGHVGCPILCERLTGDTCIRFLRRQMKLTCLGKMNYDSSTCKV